MAKPIFTGPAQPHYFLPGTVWDAALNRIRWLFDEFDNRVSVFTSGGKDSTVVTELAAIVNAERGLPPLKVKFLDQEAEYQATVDYLRTLVDRPDIDLDWYQVPFRLFNATSHTSQWNMCWDPAEEGNWIRDKEPTAITENVWTYRNGTPVDRFKDLLKELNPKGVAVLTGMRCEESPTRRVFMTTTPSYKWVTWASRDKGLFHPIYDWSYRDVWKAISTEGWIYNSFYDAMFRYGVIIPYMRVSSFHHETSMRALQYLQEIEPQTWERAVQRIPGLSTYGHVGEEIQKIKFNLPYMFNTWQEYLDHLLSTLVQTEADRAKFRQQQHALEIGLPWVPRREITKKMAHQVILNDLYGSNLEAWKSQQSKPVKRRAWASWKTEQAAHGTWSPEEELAHAHG